MDPVGEELYQLFVFCSAIYEWWIYLSSDYINSYVSIVAIGERTMHCLDIMMCQRILSTYITYPTCIQWLGSRHVILGAARGTEEEVFAFEHIVVRTELVTCLRRRKKAVVIVYQNNEVDVVGRLKIDIMHSNSTPAIDIEVGSPSYSDPIRRTIIVFQNHFVDCIENGVLNLVLICSR